MKKMKKKEIRATAARHNFQELIDAVHYTGETVIVTKYEKPWIMISPVPDKDPKSLSKK